MAKKTKLYDPIALQLEKQMLMQKCAAYESKLLGHFETIRSHPVRMALSSILPFEKGTRETVVKGLELINDTLLPVILGATFKKGKDDWTKNVLQIVQAVVISYSFKLFKKILAKKKNDVPAESAD